MHTCAKFNQTNFNLALLFWIEHVNLLMHLYLMILMVPYLYHNSIFGFTIFYEKHLLHDFCSEFMETTVMTHLLKECLLAFLPSKGKQEKSYPSIGEFFYLTNTRYMSLSTFRVEIKITLQFECFVLLIRSTVNITG